MCKEWVPKDTMREVKRKKTLEACNNCHKHSYYVSRNGLCMKCVKAKILSAQYQIRAKEGPVYDRWKEKIMLGLSKLR